ncbi:MAG TPA: OmpA family protein [Polyangiales bacterium]|nr:OmpA family protein [Polyangiales bacterium]
MDLISNAKRLLPTCTFAIALTACASSAPTDELVDARRAYDEAEDGPARTQRPGELRAAHRALHRAEDAHDDDPGSNREKRLAVDAEHRAEIADARGEAAEAEGDAQVARARANREAREARVLRARDDRSNMAKVDRDGDKAEVVVNDAPARADDDRRVDGKVDNSLQNLMHGSTVREEERGTVIIMSGALLFPSGKDELSDAAEQHLDLVAKALKEQPESTKFRVEGYTDSTGSERQNQALSTNRAKAVAKYLSDEGIDDDRIEAVGYGEQRPLASNDSDEGRASNRRIEIVIAKNADRDND